MYYSWTNTKKKKINWIILTNLVEDEKEGKKAKRIHDLKHTHTHNNACGPLGSSKIIIMTIKVNHLIHILKDRDVQIGLFSFNSTIGYLQETKWHRKNLKIKEEKSNTMQTLIKRKLGIVYLIRQKKL